MSRLLLAAAVLSVCALLEPRQALAQTTPTEADAGLPPPDDAGVLAEAPADELDGPDEPTEEPSPEELTAAPAVDAGWRYTAELSDEELARRWKEDPASLGSISIGRPEEGRLINAMPFPEPPDGGAWAVIVPESCWTTQETADAIIGAANQLREWFPEGAPVRVGQVSGKEGGYLPPHITHQNGRDIDIGLFYPGPEPYRIKEREKVMDVPMNWAFVKAMLTHGDVQYILLDKRVQKVLYDYALKHGENKAWLDALFNAGPRSVFHHARKHRDHFHVRLFNPRAQELAHRLAPLMPVRPDENIAFHRVKKGDTLGGIAVRYGSSVTKLKNVNRLANSFLRVGQVLRVPLRGPCTNCPVPPLVVVPPRRVPPPIKQG
ncbi:MAG: LysM peptidoglycan-binding domain-containing protein [Myxococcota bacterium]